MDSLEVERWRIGDIWVFVPSDWTVQEEPEPEGYNVIVPPVGGTGRLLLTGIHDNSPPPELTRDYAVLHGNKGFLSVGLSPDLVPVARHEVPGHFSAAAAGIGLEDRYVTMRVHVFPPGNIVVAYYHADDAADPFVEDAEIILFNIEPAI